MSATNLFVDGPAGRLEARLDEPAAPPRAAVVLAAPHPELGGTLLSRVLHHATEGFLRCGCDVLRFNYRGTGASHGTFDDGRGERLDMAAALDHMARRHPGLPLWAAGYSFGAWVALVAGAADPRVRVLIGIAPPVDAHDFSRVVRSEKAVFLIQGDRDQVAPLGTTRRFYAQLDEPKEIAVIDGADHAFDGMTVEVGEAVTDLLGDFDI